MSDYKKQWVISFNGESYDAETYSSREEANQAAREHGARRIAVKTAPRQPEEFIDWTDVERWIDNVSEQDDYGGEWAEDWFCGTTEQMRELANQFREVAAKWLDKHGLRPTFFTVDEDEPAELE